MNILEKFLKLEAQTIKIGVVGDAMLDQYYNIKINRISPEFPIPICLSEDESTNDFPGGAANVAYQFKHFNSDVNLIAFVDSESDDVFKSKGLNTSLCVNIPTKIPRKRRFYSDGFPTYRWDIEKENYGLGADLDEKCLELYETARKNVNLFDVLVLSDYDKGVFSKHTDSLIPECPITIVDPKSGDLDRWLGCTVFKPNKQEALALSGCDTVGDAGVFLLHKLQCKAVIITQSGDGVTVFDEQGIFEIRPTQPLPPAESVIGAGDCFTAFLAMSLGYKMKIREAAEVAWKAGSLYVKNKHNKPLSRTDILQTFDPTANKIIPCPESFFRDKNYKLVMSNGCFDIIHAAHLEVLKQAKNLGDKLVVAVNSDESVSKLKPGRPIITLQHRMALLASLEFVDFVVSFNEETPLEIINQIKPDVLVKGGDYKKEDIVGYGIVNEIVTIPMVHGLSTTNIIAKIRN